MLVGRLKGVQVLQNRSILLKEVANEGKIQFRTRLVANQTHTDAIDYKHTFSRVELTSISLKVSQQTS